MGGVVGLALIGLALFLCLRRRRSKRLESSSEKSLNGTQPYEPANDAQVITPFAKPSAGSTPARSDFTRLNTDSSAGYPVTMEKNLDSPSSYDDTVFGEASTTQPPATSPAVSSSRSGPPAERRIQHAEDMEDAEDEVSMLPPMYKESWGQRQYAADMEGDAVGVHRPLPESASNFARAKDAVLQSIPPMSSKPPK